MTNLLSINQNRQLQLLEYLNKSKMASQKTILTELNYNKQTLITDINTINGVIAPLSIQNFSHQGIQLTIPPNYNFDYIYSCYLSISNEYALIEILFFDETHSLSSLSDKLYLSISTLRRLILKVNDTLQESDISISSQPLSLIGNEQKIYRFMISYLFERYSPTDPFFSSPPIECIEQIIHIMAEKNKVPLNYPDLNRAKIWIFTILTRLKNGHFPTKPQVIPPNIDTSITNNSSITNSFTAHFKLPLTNDILAYMFQFFLIKDYAFNFQMLQLLASQNRSINNKLNIIDHTLSLLSDKFYLPLENKETMIFELYNTTLLTGDNSFILNNRNKIFVDSITRYNKPFLRILNRELANLYTQKQMTESEMYALAYCLTTHWPQLSLKLQSIQKKIRVGLFFYTDSEHTDYIKDELTYYFRDKLQIEPMEELSLLDFKRHAPTYDIIITNIYALEVEDVEILSFPFTPSIREYKLIEEIVEKIDRNK